MCLAGVLASRPARGHTREGVQCLTSKSSNPRVWARACVGTRACGQVIESIADDLIVSLKHIPDVLMDKRALKARTEGLRGRRWGVRVGRVVILVGGDRRRWMGQGR